MPSAHSSLAVTLYRACLRSTRVPAIKHGRFRLPLDTLPESIATFARELRPGRNQAGLQALVKAAWREGAKATEPAEIRQREDDAFRALRALSDLQSDCEKVIADRVANADRTGIHFCVGEVLRHKKFGFRAVVIGWDRRPETDVSGWDGVVGLPSGADQPFYRMLPDLTDCIENLGGPRDVRYVAQENLERLPPAHRRIAHPRLTPSLFSRYDAIHGRWVPSESLAFRYPGSLVSHAHGVASRSGHGKAALAAGREAVGASAFPPSLLASATAVATSVQTVTSGLFAFINAAATRDAAARLEASDAIAHEMRVTEAARAEAAASEAGENAGGDAPGSPSTVGGVMILRPAQDGSDPMARDAGRRMGPGRDMFRDLRMLLRRSDAALATLRPILPPPPDAVSEGGVGTSESAASASAAAGPAVELEDDDGYGDDDILGYDEYGEDEYDDGEDYDEEPRGDAANGRPRAAGGGPAGGEDGDVPTAAAAGELVKSIGTHGQDEAVLSGTYKALRALLKVSDYIQTNLGERASKVRREGIRFHVGQVLRHKKFGFRAVVFGWEERPATDVAHWDGVVGLPSGAEQPFYRMVPDHDDCVSLLGGPRGVRYVAQENLEPLPNLGEAAIEHELLPHLFHAYDAGRGTFVPVQQLAFWYPSDAPPPLPAESVAEPVAGGGGEGVGEEASAILQTAGASLQSVVRAVESARDLLRAHTLDEATSGRLSDLLPLLHHARNGEEASVAERAATGLLAAHPSSELLDLLAAAEARLETDDVPAALELLDRAEALDERHADTYVRRASAYMKAGRARRALADASRALEIEPRHVIALRIKATALRGSRRYEEAIEAYEAALLAHPWAPGVVNGVYRATRSLQARGGASSGARESQRGERSSRRSSSSTSSSSRTNK